MLLFVYGTLKKGQPNHGLLHFHKYADFLGEDLVKGYTLWSLNRIPLAMRSLTAQLASQEYIEGEVWDVCPEAIIKIDVLEGHPIFYKRTAIVTVNEYVAGLYVWRHNSEGRIHIGSRWPSPNLPALTLEDIV